MKTEFQQENQEFSDKAHNTAQMTIYPWYFGVSTQQLEFETTSVSMGGKAQILDGEMAVDRIVKVKVDYLKYPVEFTVQERFRRMEHSFWRDITITEWNHNSDLPSELYKLKSGIFVYGYYNDFNKTFGEVIVANTVSLIDAIVRNKVEFIRKMNKKNQTFLGFKFDELESKGIITKHYYPK